MTETGEIGGAEINLLSIATELHSRRWDVAAVVPAEGPLTRRLRQAGVSVTIVPRLPFVSTSLEFHSNRKIPNFFSLPVNALVGLLWALRLYSLFRQERPCIVHTVSMWTHVFAGLASRLAGCKTVWHFQDIVSPRAGWGFYRWLVIQGACHIPDCILCVSERVAEQFQGERHLVEKTHILENTVHIARFQRGRQGSRRQRKPFTIGTVARFTPWKGHETALRAAYILRTLGLSFRWLFAGDESLGDPAYGKRLRKLAQDLRDTVVFCGWIDDIVQFYEELDVLVHVPVQPEPFGLVLAEAMAVGLPIITTTGGGAEGVVRDAGGVLVPPNQPEAVAEVIAAFVRDPGEAYRRGQVARRYAERHFDFSDYISRLIEIYRQLHSNWE